MISCICIAPVTLRDIQMAKRQYNFRLDEKLMEQVKSDAEFRDMTLTEWIEDACLISLGITDEDRDSAYRIQSKHDRDRITQLENQLKTLQKQLNDHVSRIDERIDSLWDGMDYMGDDLEATKKSTKDVGKLASDFIKAMEADIKYREDNGLPHRVYDLKSYIDKYKPKD